MGSCSCCGYRERNWPLATDHWPLKQRHSHAAFGTEFWPAFRLVAAARTGQLELNRAAAFRAELAAGGLSAARRASERRLRRAGAGAHVDARRVIGLLRFLMKLIARRIRHGLRAVGGELFFKVGCALFAQPRLGVPADLWADPL